MIFNILKFIGISVTIPTVIALGLIASQRPGAPAATEGGLDFSDQLSGQAPRALALNAVRMRDGHALQTRHLSGPPGAPLLLLVHGSGWHGQQFDRLAARLADVAEVLAPDLRGHGTSPGRRGDVDHIGQLEEDLSDLVAAHRKPGQKVVLAGHSSGGGLVVRYAGGTGLEPVDGAILMAPFLKYNAPTTRPNSGGWARPLTRRIIGLAMLNAVRFRALNHLTAIEFNMPRAVLDGPLGDTATTAYSFRLNTSFAPRGDYLADVARLPRFLLIAGAEDESMVAGAYEPVMSGATDKGRYLTLPGVGHLALVDAPATEAAIREFLSGV